MIYLLDANVLITASNKYYLINRIPEFWEWLLYQANAGNVKMPREIIEEVLEGRKKDDLLLDWMKDNKDILLLNEDVDPILFRQVVEEGYAPDLNDSEVEGLGKDPFLVAYALAESNRSVVTTEVSAPAKTRQNRKLPNVCETFSVGRTGPYRVFEPGGIPVSGSEFIDGSNLGYDGRTKGHPAGSLEL